MKIHQKQKRSEMAYQYLFAYSPGYGDYIPASERKLFGQSEAIRGNRVSWDTHHVFVGNGPVVDPASSRGNVLLLIWSLKKSEYKSIARSETILLAP